MDLRVNKIRLKNWRNFRQAEIALTDRMFLVGPNASGKSNLLDAFRFLRDIAKPGGGMLKAVDDRGGLSKVRCLTARRASEVEIEVDLVSSENGGPVQWRYTLGLEQENFGRRRTLVSKEVVTRNGEKKLGRPDSEDKRDDARLTQTFLEQINVNEKFRELSTYFSNIQYLHIVPQLVRHAEAFTGPELPGDPFGRRILERIATTPERQRLKRLRQIEGALRVAVPQLSTLKLVKDDVGRPHLEVVYEHWRPHGALQREDQLSDGTLRLIGLLWSLLDGNGSLLLLEEPELSLHAAVVRQLPAIIFELQAATGRQIVISTHSADLLFDKGIGGEEVLLLAPTDTGTEVTPASSIREIRALLEQGLSVGETVLSRTEPKSVHQLQLPFVRK